MDVFGGDAPEGIAAEWIKRFDAHESSAVKEVVNLVLRAAGCEVTVDSHDIEDPDHCSNKLQDVQEEFQSVSPTEASPV